jgi:hypothetical protein
MRNEVLVTHTPIEVTTITLRLFQMAKLQASISMRSSALYRRTAKDIHAKQNQELSGGEGEVGEDLREREEC